MAPGATLTLHEVHMDPDKVLTAWLRERPLRRSACIIDSGGFTWVTLAESGRRFYAYEADAGRAILKAIDKADRG